MKNLVAALIAALALGAALNVDAEGWIASGQIQIQSEAAECYYKEMKIRPITRFPADIEAALPSPLKVAE